MRLLVANGLAIAIALNAGMAGTHDLQPAVRASEASIQAPAAGATEATALVAIDNGTMYDVYIVGAETDAAAAIELRDTPRGASDPVAVKEVSVPAYGRLEMSPGGVHLRLTSITRPLSAGVVLNIVLHTDGGERLTVAATVK